MSAIAVADMFVDTQEKSLGHCLSLSGFGRPFGLGKDEQGRLHVSDMDLNCLFRFAPDLKTVEVLRDHSGWNDPLPVVEGHLPVAAPVKPELFHGPHSVDFLKTGLAGDIPIMAVVCYYSPALHIHDVNGRIIRTWTKLSHETGVLTGPATGVACCDTGSLIVAEYAQNRILRVDPQTGKAVDINQLNNTLGYDRPHMAITSPTGEIIVADTWNDRLVRVCNKSAQIAFLSDHQGWRLMEQGKSLGKVHNSQFPLFDKPVAVAHHSHNRLLVTCWGSGLLYDLSLSGNEIRRVPIPVLTKPYDARFFGNQLVIAHSHYGKVEIWSGLNENAR